MAPSIHVGASLHDVPEKGEDDDYEKDEEEEDDDGDNDIIWGETPKDEDNEEEEDDAQFVDTDPIPPKCWTESQQAQQDEQESSLVTEILSDDEKQWEVLMLVDSEAAAQVSGAAETVDYFG